MSGLPPTKLPSPNAAPPKDMSPKDQSAKNPPKKKQPLRWVGLLAAFLVVLILITLMVFYWYYPSQAGLEQPISFSHRFHVGTKGLSCVLCHGGAVGHARAGMPPVATCMMCHSQVITTHPQIQRLREHYEKGVPISWARVNEVPEFVYFNHQVHVRRGFDCGCCHGDVASMDRVTPSPELLMGFCVQCHRDNNASQDCTMCHR